jgi:hypothetical protein
MVSKRTLFLKRVLMLSKTTFDNESVFKINNLQLIYFNCYLFVMKTSKNRLDVLSELPTDNNTATTSNYNSIVQVSSLHTRI